MEHQKYDVPEHWFVAMIMGASERQKYAACHDGVRMAKANLNAALIAFQGQR